jgi:hypothetical protein
MEIKKIVVCGDSLCSAEVNDNCHFSDILASRGYEVINLARGSMTNTGICFQIKQAIDIQAELVIFCQTDASRLDIPLYPSPSPNITLKNFIYPYRSDSSFGNKYVGDATANILSDNAYGLSNQRPDSLTRVPDNIVIAIKNYYTFIFDQYLAEEKDRWIFEYWKQRLFTASIPYIELTAAGIGREIYEYIRKNPDKATQKVYHTTVEPQQKVADSIIHQIEKCNQIGCITQNNLL